MTNNEEMFFMAKEYAAKGWRVLCLHGVNDDLSCTCGTPNCTDTGKHPVTQRGVKDGTIDLAKIEQWFMIDPGNEPDHMKQRRNVGIVAGEVSGITILDIDNGPGKVGGQTYVELTQEHGDPPTLRATTGSGGIHLIFQYNSALKTSSNTLGKHIDCRNDNGYIVAPPSRHKSGPDKRYSWDNWGTIDPRPLPAHLTKKKDKETRGRPRTDDLYRRKYTFEQVKAMLEHIPAHDRDLWRHVGIILGREFHRSDEAWVLYQDWSNTWTGQKGRGHDDIMRQAFHEKSQEKSDNDLSLGTIIHTAIQHGWTPRKGDGSVESFVYDHESNRFIYRKSGALWVARSVDVACGEVNVEGRLLKASLWIQEHARVTTTTSTPAIKGDVLKDFDCRDGVLFESPGGAVYNRYRPPTITLGEASMAGPWLDHVHRLMDKPGDADQFINYLAHRVQKPWEKPRFALLLSGGQGVGKDSAVEPCCAAIGDWNVASIEPSAFDAPYNDYASATLIRISEASNLHEMSKWAFNERTKVLIAGTPDTCRINPKYGRQYVVKMFCGVILTTNNLVSGIYLPPDDRRYDVIECATREEMKLADETAHRTYFKDLWAWINDGGTAHVAAFLHERDLSGFSASNGQRKTAAHAEVVRTGMAGDEWLHDIVDGYDNADLLNGSWILEKAIGMGEKKETVRVRMGHALQRLGYEVLPNRHYKDGRWKLNGVLSRIYRKRDYRPSPEPDWQKELELRFRQEP